MPKKDTRDFIKALEKEGYSVSRSGSGHYKAKIDGYPMLVLPFSPSSNRWLAQILAIMKREGHPIPSQYR